MIKEVFLSKCGLNIALKGYCSNIKLALGLAIFFILLSIPAVVQARQPKSALSAEELEDLAVIIKAVENALFNIKIESEAWEEHSTSASGLWQRTPIYWSSTAWFSGNWSSRMWNADQHTFDRHIQGKARVDVHKEVLEWQEGAAPYIEESYSVGFDGQYGRMARHTVGYNGKTRPVKEAKLLGDAPIRLETNALTGTSFSLQFFEGEIYKFSKMLELASDPNSKVIEEVKFTREEFEGIECIKISSKFGNLMYWLDPSRGFALRGKKSIDQYEDGHEELVTFMKVSGLKEVAPGIWWPMEASIVSRPYAPGKPWRRFVYRATNVVANDPNFDENIFIVPFPDGYLIDDQVAGRKYTVGEE